MNMNIKYLVVYYICGCSGRVHSNVRGSNTTIVEGPIERHQSRLSARETGDGLTGIHSGGSLNRTETVPKWPRERRTRAGPREAYRREKAMRS